MNNILYPTNQAACYALGILGDDKEWEESIIETSFFSSSSQIRNLFVILLLFCNVRDPNSLFEKCWKLMTDDVVYRARKLFNNSKFQIPEKELKNFVLYELENLLNVN